ncbi:MAG: hypothetical protein HN396_10825 [Gemmatimonadales bacterium]|nr:hypothetical protein [Gemmatimonadales bacterium]
MSKTPSKLLEFPKGTPTSLPPETSARLLGRARALEQGPSPISPANLGAAVESLKVNFTVTDEQRLQEIWSRAVVQIAIPSNMDTLNAFFVDSLSALSKPGTFIQDIFRCSTIDDMRNMAVEAALDAKVKAGLGSAREVTHLFMLDSDMLYPSDALLQLLASDVDVVAGWGCARTKPFYHNFLIPSATGDFFDVPSTLPTPPGLHEVGAVGACGMLIRREVLEAIEPPWFKFDTDEETGTPMGEDVYFCRKAREAGFKIWCRTDLRYGHLISSVVYPHHQEDGEYQPQIQQGIY